MPENKDDILCPVGSYRNYLEKLNPNNEFLWQTPFQNFDSMRPFWYGKQHQGKNTLGKFMTEVSKHCNLSKKYTNHSIRVTGITLLTRMQFSASEIMAVSGHKSVQSLTNYQHTQAKQKINMGKVLYQSITRKEEDMERPELQAKSPIKAIEYPKQQSLNVNAEPKIAMAPRNVVAVVPGKENIHASDAVVPFQPDFNEDGLADFDLVDILNEFEKNQNNQPAQNSIENSKVASVNMTTSIVNHVPHAMFSNCNIQNITFNIQK